MIPWSLLSSRVTDLSISIQQAVANKMQQIANQYTNEQEKRVYQNAANRFRLPFWDPFLPRNKVDKSPVLNEGIWGIPQILGQQSVWVKRPAVADLKPMDNPLYQFTFPSQGTLTRKGRVAVNFSGTRVVSISVCPNLDIHIP